MKNLTHLNQKEQSSLLVYFLDGAYVFAKINDQKTAIGNSQLKVTSFKNELYYQLDINSKNKIGNAKVGVSMPFKDRFASKVIVSTEQKMDCLEEAKSGGGLYELLNRRHMWIKLALCYSMWF